MTAHAHIAGRVTAYPQERQTAASTAFMPNARPRRRGQAPVAAQRCAEGAGLDGGDLGRSTIICAVHHTRRNSTDDDLPMNVFATSRIYTSLTGTTGTRLNPGTIILHRDAGFTVCVCTPIGRIGDELVEGRIPWATPFDRPAIDPARQVKLVLEEPKKRLPYTAKFGDLVDGECDRHAWTRRSGSLLQAVTCFKKANPGAPTTSSPRRAFS